MLSEQTKHQMDIAMQAQEQRKAEAKSQDLLHSELRSALRPVMEKLDAIEERLIVLQNALIPKNQ